MKNLRNKQVISMKTTISSHTPATKMIYNLSLKSLLQRGQILISLEKHLP